MADVEFRNVCKIYDKKVHAVEDLSFVCHNGEFFAILGPSGCGKTSSLRMLAGLEDISKGEVLIGDKVVNKMTSRERNVAMSFENYGLYPDFTIFDNIAYPLRIHKTPEETIKKKVLSIAKKLHLLSTLDLKPSALSGGQKQRVSIARALVRNPDVTIMDEPLSHLDARMRSNMRSVIKHLHDQLGLTTIYVTHDQIEAMTMADKILIMNEGHKQQIGTPDEVYYYPVNIFVAGFIGTPQMNLIESSIRKNEDGLKAVIENTIFIDVSKYGENIYDGMNVSLGIRPKDIAISHKFEQGFEKGKIYVVETLGESTIISIQIGNTILRVEKDGYLTDWDFDDEIFFQIIPEHIHLFDNNTGMRIIPEDENKNDAN
ncbi:MAG: ABC transporter ATP-binding protein [Lachnospiraceae bacterium]|nr:ABC transporter ATP-binding protein [Lachnospiraceae bacterium]